MVNTSILGLLTLDVAVDSKSEVSGPVNCLKLSLTLPADDTTFKGMALVWRLIFLDPVIPSWVM
jgi:hypothetical protein